MEQDEIIVSTALHKQDGEGKKGKIRRQWGGKGTDDLHRFFSLLGELRNENFSMILESLQLSTLPPQSKVILKIQHSLSSIPVCNKGQVSRRVLKAREETGGSNLRQNPSTILISDKHFLQESRHS